MKWYRWVLLLITLAGVYGLSYSPDVSVTNFQSSGATIVWTWPPLRTMLAFSDMGAP